MRFHTLSQAAKVYTPKDGYLWHMAKVQIEICDIFTSQIYEHLVNGHFRMEPLCIAMERHLSTKHPLYEILKYHCRGIFAVNSGIASTLVDDGGHVHQLYGYGSRGAHQLARRGYKKMLWDDINLESSIEVCKGSRSFHTWRGSYHGYFRGT